MGRYKLRPPAQVELAKAEYRRSRVVSNQFPPTAQGHNSTPLANCPAGAVVYLGPAARRPRELAGVPNTPRLRGLWPPLGFARPSSRRGCFYPCKARVGTRP
jgi:hypothetical protein